MADGEECVPDHQREDFHAETELHSSKSDASWIWLRRLLIIVGVARIWAGCPLEDGPLLVDEDVIHWRRGW